MRVATVTTLSKRSGREELFFWALAAVEAGAQMLVLPSSFLPFYCNPNAFYVREQLEGMASVLPNSLRIIVGVNESDAPNRYKSVAMLHRGVVRDWHRKSVLESHYVQKGFTAGDKSPHVFFGDDGIEPRICMMECFEVIQPHLWPSAAHIVTASVGFGMRATTNNYDCDYWDQWISIVKAQCLRTRTWCILSCNGKHDEAMTAVVNKGGQVVASLLQPGMLVVDIDLAKRYTVYNPYAQDDD